MYRRAMGRDPAGIGYRCKWTIAQLLKWGSNPLAFKPKPPSASKTLDVCPCFRAASIGECTRLKRLHKDLMLGSDKRLAAIFFRSSFSENATE